MISGPMPSPGNKMILASTPIGPFVSDAKIVDMPIAVAGYRAFVLDYNGPRWGEPAESNFLAAVRAGAGVAVIHAANNAFPDWKEYNQMIAVGGWAGRTEEHGPSVYWEDERLQYNYEPGRGGHHGDRHPFLIVARKPKHPILSGLPKAWMHATDELYDTLRGPAREMDVLATAYSAPNTRGTGRDEPILLAVRYGKGRVFHTTLGHDLVAMQCVGFITTLQRGTEWAARGKVSQKVPRDFPSTMRVRTRE